jgi:hypothetical protein
MLSTVVGVEAEWGSEDVFGLICNAWPCFMVIISESLTVYYKSIIMLCVINQIMHDNSYVTWMLGMKHLIILCLTCNM